MSSDLDSGTTTTTQSFEAFYEALHGSRPPGNRSDRLEQFWDGPVAELCRLEQPAALSEADKERHRLYAGALMSIAWHYWCGNKKGRRGTYPLNAPADPDEPAWLERDYYGHNIAALAVDGAGRVLDFEFNHNELFSSTAEHAEARLVRRLISLGQLADTWQAPAAAGRDPTRSTAGYINLDRVTIYTTLESCSQCAGIMALAQIHEIVYLQTDPGMYFIGRILRNLTMGTGLEAPLPISGGEIDLPQFAALDRAFEAWPGQVAATPFFVPSDGSEPDRSRSVTSFLCSRGARDVFGFGRQAFQSLRADPTTLRFPDDPRPGSLTNREVLEEAGGFVDYAVEHGRRATPHVS